MNLNIVTIDFLNNTGELLTYRFIPKNHHNHVVIDRLDDICHDVKGNSNEDIGAVRIYNADDCEVNKTKCKLKGFNQNFKSYEITFQFEHMFIPIGPSTEGSAGIYNFILPPAWRLTELFIVDPFDTHTDDYTMKKKFKYDILWDTEKKIQFVEMILRSRRGSFSFQLYGKAKQIYKSDSIYLESKEIEDGVFLDRGLDDNFFKEPAKSTFIKNFKESLILQPNYNGIGIDLKRFFRKS